MGQTMSDFLESIASIKASAKAEASRVTSLQEAKEAKVQYLGKKGKVTELLKGLGQVSKEDRPLVGKKVNELKQELDELFDTLLSQHEQSEQLKKIQSEQVDITLPGRRVRPGFRHPLRKVMDEIIAVFQGLGFSVEEGPEVETDFYNFEALNVPANHPARDMQDTFYVSDELLLRTHTSPVQIHTMQREKPPIAIIAPGCVYRRDNDVSHSPMFHQVEGLLVDEGISFAHLKSVLSLFCKQMFGERGVRFRPSFFPFTEPSAEVDIECVICDGKGCRVCKNTGWVEILGSGMVDPAVFEAVGYDPKKVSGFAFGMGVERVAMLKYSIDDIRLFYENDLRFLEQF